MNDLTHDQVGGLAFLDNFLDSTRADETAFAALLGYAGVGKTWLLGHWLQQVQAARPGFKVVVTAPTNKAVDVLRGKCGKLDANFRTLDSFLGFRVKRDDDWKMQRSRNTQLGGDTPDLVVVDEASMVKLEYHQELEARSVRVLYVGDPAQLQPVGEALSPALDVPDSYLMTEVVRQGAGNPIIELATYLRTCIEEDRTFILQDLRDFAKAGDRRFAFAGMRNVHDWADAAINKGLDCRILAFTNAAVHANNAAMHARRYPDAPLYGEGELVLVNEAFDYDDDTLLTNGELLRVKECVRAEPIAGVDVYDVIAQRLANSLEIDGKTVGGTLKLTVALDPEHALRVHRDLTSKIYELRREGKIGKADELFVLRRPLNNLAPLRHSYACTVHKSQGSTYDVALVDFADIYRSREMRARLMYVAATRPSKYLVLLHSWRLI